MKNKSSSGQANAPIMAQRPINDHQIMAGGAGNVTRGVPLMMPYRNSPSPGIQQHQNFQVNQMHLQQQQHQHNNGLNGPTMQQNQQHQPQMQMVVGPNNQQHMNSSSGSNMQGRMQAPQRSFQQPQPQPQQANVRPMHLESQHQMHQSPISPRMDISGGPSGMMVDRNGQSSTQVTQGSPNNLSPQNGDIQRMLHLYMHDYCLKNNMIKTANSIAFETGVRTDEGVPFGKEHDQGLLLEWFRTFWQNYVKAQQDQPPNSRRSQQSDLSQDLFSQFDKPQAMTEGLSGHFPFGQSSEMRRTETEPIFRKNSSQVNHNGPLGGGSLTPSPFGTGASAAARFWGASDLSDDSVMQQLTPRTLGRETAASMQRMGWEGRPIESLSGEEKNKLANAVRQSQINQQNASMQLINTLQPSPIALSKIGANETGNGNNQNLGRQSPNLSIGLSSPISTMPVPPSPTTSKGPSSGVPAFNNTRKSPGQSISRKKRRSSVNLQALSQIQGANQSGNNTSPVTNRKNGQVPPPPASPAEAARTFEEHQNLAKQLQSQSQSIIGQQGLVSPASKRTNLSKAQQAQSDAQTHATSQISAQIQQLQHQLMRESNAGGGNQTNNQAGSVAMQKNPSNSSNQISQLRILQGKLSQNNRDQDDQSGNSQNRLNRSGSIQGPIVASQMPPASPITSMGPPMSAPATPFNFASQQQRMSAINNSPSSAFFSGGMGMPANWQGNGMMDAEQQQGGGGNVNPHQAGGNGGGPMHFASQQDSMMNSGNNNMHPPQQGPLGPMNGLGLGFGGQPGGPPAQQQQQQQQQQMLHIPDQSPMMSFDPQSQHPQNQMGLSPFTAQGQNQNPMAFLQSPKQAQQQQQGEMMTQMQPPSMMDQSIWSSMGMGGMENQGMNESFNS
ncbi:hypothetical protein L7F22_043570 [Adiantum nelumboides]|nr:hypothetical protein [Adiantum nelumboides]